ncbi:hypothetical protein ACGF5F_34655 [Streptomyces sp. NPDC047821]|uniref:hypothetical protein n=1 Tax=Streptomyces sp. NPDC047821 TaxID=3365488 RepID=UPI00371F45D1
MHGEAAVFVDVVAVGGPGSVVGVAGVADGVDEGAAGAEDAADLADVLELPLPVPAVGQLGPRKPTPELLEKVFQQLLDVRP